VGRKEDGGGQQVRDVSALTSDVIADESERHVADPHPGLHHEEIAGRGRPPESCAALRRRRLEITGQPKIETPPREQRAGVHQREDYGERADAAAEDVAESAGCTSA